MYLLVKFGDHRSYRNRDINSYTNSYMDTLEKPELAALIRHIAIFLKSGMPIYNYEVPNTADRRRKRKRRRRRRRRRTQAITKRHEFHANAIIDRGVWIYFLITIAVTRLKITYKIYDKFSSILSLLWTFRPFRPTFADIAQNDSKFSLENFLTFWQASTFEHVSLSSTKNDSFTFFKVLSVVW